MSKYGFRAKYCSANSRDPKSRHFLIFLPKDFNWVNQSLSHKEQLMGYPNLHHLVNFLSSPHLHLIMHLILIFLLGAGQLSL